MRQITDVLGSGLVRAAALGIAGFAALLAGIARLADTPAGLQNVLWGLLGVALAVMARCAGASPTAGDASDEW